MNILASPLPREVVVGGVRVPIRTSYRVGIQVARTVESGHHERLIAGTILRLYFGDESIPADVNGALSAAMDFHRMNAPAPNKKPSTSRAWDWDHDQGRVLADFKREYGIDLADPDLTLHWFTFWTYFENLSIDSESKRAMYYRTATKPRELKGDDAKRWNEHKRYYALPPKGTDEYIAAEAALWGDDA